MPHPHDAGAMTGGWPTGQGMLPSLQLLGQLPEAAYFSFQDQGGQSPRQQRYFQGQFSNVFNQFLGGLGRQLGQGQNVPTGTFEDFLGDYNFGQQFSQLPPSVRGATTSRFAPPARFLPF